MILTDSQLRKLQESARQTTFLIAILLDKFCCTPEQIAGWTDKQIFNFFLHERDEHGAITRPLIATRAPDQEEGPPTYEGELMQLDILRLACRLTDENYLAVRKQLAAKFDRSE